MIITHSSLKLPHAVNFYDAKVFDYLQQVEDAINKILY